MSLRICFDIDGTIDLNLWGTWTHLPTGRRLLNPGINPAKVKYVITGRPESKRELTMQHLTELGVTPKVLFMNPLGILDFEYIMMMKACYLRILKADIYVDDDVTWKFKMHKYWDGLVIESSELGRYV